MTSGEEEMMVRGVVLKMVAVMGIMSVGAGTVVAQRTVEYAAHNSSEGQMSQAASPVAKTVSVDFQNTRVRDAVKTIIEQSGVTIFYSSDMLPKETRVTFAAKHITAEAALTAVLGSLSLGVERMAGGELRVVRVSGAQEGDGIVTGKVLHAKTRRPIEGVTVTIDGLKQEAKTAADGTFRMQAPSGEHTLRVRGLGFVRQDKTITVGDGKTITVEVVLDPNASVLDEVVVTGTVVATQRRELPNPITVITADDIEKRGITQVDQLFRGEVPGVLALDLGSAAYSDEWGAGVQSMMYSRGVASLDGAANPLKTYIDGVELLDASYLATIDPKSIERIEVITGPQVATIYGSGALGGVMQIFTKRGVGSRVPEVTLDLRYGVMQSNFSSSLTPMHRNGLGVRGGIGADFTYSGEVSYEYSGQWQPFLYARTYGTSVGVSHTNGALTTSGALGVRYRENGTYSRGGVGYCNVSPNRRTCWGSPLMRSLLSEGKRRQVGSQVIANTISQKVSWTRGQTEAFNLDYRVFGWNHHLTLGRNESFIEQDPKAPMYYKSYDSLYEVASSSGYRTTAAYNASASFSRSWFQSQLTVGGNGVWANESRSSGCMSEANPRNVIACPYLSSSYAMTHTQSVDDDSRGGFGSLRLGFFDRVFLSSGIRGETNPHYGQERKIDWTPTYGVAVLSAYNDLTIKVYGSYGRATRPPVPGYRDPVHEVSASYEPSEFTTQLGNPFLRPERSLGGQFGAEVYYSTIASLSINHYQQYVTDLIQRALVDSIPVVVRRSGNPGFVDQWQYLNGGKMRQKGWETVLSLTYGPFNAKGTYSWQDSRIVYMNENIWQRNRWGRAGQVFLGVPTHTGNLVVSYAHEAWSGTLISNFIGSSIENFSSPNVLYALSERIAMYGLRFSSTGGAQRERPGYEKVDLSLVRRVSGRISFNVRMQNILNRVNSDFGEWFPALGRQTMFGISLRRLGK